ncbi:MAG: hypothetical protein ACRENG_33465, partial [bacterium]
MSKLPRQRRHRRPANETSAASELQLLSQSAIETDHREAPVERDGHAASDVSEDRNERIKELVRQLLLELGEDPKREGLRRTPKRVDRA